MKKVFSIVIFILLIIPNNVLSQTNQIYKIDFSVPDLSIFNSDSTLDMGWGADAINKWIGSTIWTGDKTFTLKGKILLFKQNGSSDKINDNLIIKCVKLTNQDWEQFSAKIDKNGSFEGTVYMTSARNNTTFKFLVYQINPASGKIQGSRLAYFQIHLD
jgi:hypothetical protein